MLLCDYICNHTIFFLEKKWKSEKSEEKRVEERRKTFWSMLLSHCPSYDQD